MKTYFCYVFLLLGYLLPARPCQAQTIVDYTQFGVMKADYDHRAVLYLGSSRQAARTILGAPSMTSVYFAEMDNINLDVWMYGGNKFYFDQQGLVAFEINDATLAVGLNYAAAFRVGDSAGSGTFHGVALNATPSISRNISYSQIALAGLKSGDTTIDAGAEVLFDASGHVFNIWLDSL